jgi:hypothetical protein
MGTRLYDGNPGYMTGISLYDGIQATVYDVTEQVSSTVLSIYCVVMFI